MSYWIKESEEKEGVKMKRVLLIYLIVLLCSAILSCKKEQSRQEKASQPVNPYTSESVFLEIKKKLQENPSDADLWYHLGDLYDRNGIYPEAIEAFKKAVSFKPDMGYAYFKMGTAYNRINRPEEAVKSLEKAIKLMPDYAVAYNNLAIAYGKMGDVSKEIENLEKAIRLRPGYGIARYNLGVAYLKRKDKDAAKMEYESLKGIDKGLAEELLKKIEDKGSRAK